MPMCRLMERARIYEAMHALADKLSTNSENAIVCAEVLYAFLTNQDYARYV